MSVWSLILFSLFSCVFSKMNIYCKHSNNIFIKSKRVETRSFVVAEIRPQPFPKSTVPPRVTWARALPRAGWGLESHRSLGSKAAGHWVCFPSVTWTNGMSLHLLLTYYPTGQLRVTLGSLSSWSRAVGQCALAECCFILWQSEPVTRCNETWRRQRCELLQHPRKEREGGKFMLKHPRSTALVVAFAWLFFLYNFTWNSVFSLLPASRYFMRGFDEATCLVILAPSKVMR